jgi:hypothetical protein
VQQIVQKKSGLVGASWKIIFPDTLRFIWSNSWQIFNDHSQILQKRRTAKIPYIFLSISLLVHDLSLSLSPPFSFLSSAPLSLLLTLFPFVYKLYISSREILPYQKVLSSNSFLSKSRLVSTNFYEQLIRLIIKHVGKILRN